jgi:uncharacterized protein YuzE
MIFRYYPDTDMLYIELISQVSTESEEVAPNIVLDFDNNNQVIGIEIENASQVIDLSRLELTALPFADLVFSKSLPSMKVQARQQA